MTLTKLRSYDGKIPAALSCDLVTTNNLNHGFLFHASSRRIKLASTGTAAFALKRRRRVTAIDLNWTRHAFISASKHDLT